MSNINETTPTSLAPSTPALDETEIKVRAHALWEAEGSPEGRLEEYWDRARDLMEAEGETSYPPSQSRAHRT
jgi:hypothetical protein